MDGAVHITSLSQKYSSLKVRIKQNVLQARAGLPSRGKPKARGKGQQEPYETQKGKLWSASLEQTNPCNGTGWGLSARQQLCWKGLDSTGG